MITDLDPQDLNPLPADRHVGLVYDALFIGGDWTAPSTSQRLTVRNPAGGHVVGSCPSAGPADVTAAVTAARTTFDRGDWSGLDYPTRAGYLYRLAQELDAAHDQLLELVVSEMGSPMRWATPRQILHPVKILRYYAQLGSSGLAHSIRRYPSLNRGPFTVYNRPVGVVAAITPWNMPLKTAVMKLAPALLAGCTVILKPAPNTPLSALALAELAAGILPEGVLSVLPGDDTTGALLARDPGVDKVAFTGSVQAGQAIGALCGGTGRRFTLELGGKSAAIIMDGADLDRVVAALRDDTFGNSGQVCSAHTRILAPRHLLKRTTELLCDQAATLRVGAPTDPRTDIGPLVSWTQWERVVGYITDARRSESTVAYGQDRYDRPDTGPYLSPHVFSDVHPAAGIAQEEVFGPVVCTIGYDDLDDAVRIANGTPYGLEAAVWGEPSAAVQLAARLRAGTVRVNGADPGLSAPLGGFGMSGVGRELGPEGLDAYQEPQVVTLL